MQIEENKVKSLSDFFYLFIFSCNDNRSAEKVYTSVTLSSLISTVTE